MPETTERNPDIKLAFDTIKGKKPLYDELYKYYEGDHPLRYSASRLYKIFNKLDVFFAENWLSVIIDSVLDRMILSGFDISRNDEAKKEIDDLWRDHNIMLIAEEVHESVSITREGYVIALEVENDEGETELDIYYNDARMCHVFYSKDQPNKKRVAAKLWQDDEGFTRLTLYYKDRFEYYKSNKALKRGQLVPSANALLLDPDLPEEENPFDVIPVFHWTMSRTTKKRDMGKSEISMQDAINKLLNDMMVSSEFNSFVQRVIISKADPGNMPNEPGANWWIPASDDGQGAEVKELGGRDLKGFLDGLDKLATHLAIISRTPKHYFFNQGGDPSGEALIALEAPLNKKVKKREMRCGVEWQNFAQFLLEVRKMKVDKSQIVPVWEPVETIQPKTLAEITKLDKEAGIPVTTSKRRQGWSENEMKQLEEDQKKEQQQRSGLAQDALDKLRKEDEQNNNNTGTNTQA